MPTRETETNAGVGPAAKQVAEHASSLARLELELAALELKRKITSLGLGIGFAIGAAVMSLFLIGFLYAAIAAGLATTLPVWGALLIVSGIILLQIAILGWLARSRIKKGTPPLPEQAIQEAKLTTEALKSNGR
jgi:membrane-bound ClpP family serine protease